ncbi:MAG: ATPase domain-containing protein [Candidatus Micrarchaeota archaeon]
MKEKKIEIEETLGIKKKSVGKKIDEKKNDKKNGIKDAKNKKEESFDLEVVEKAEKESEQKTQEESKFKKLERVQSGIFGFDELIEGGFEKDSTILVTGSAGTGKTTFGLQFLYYGVKTFNEPGILISFEESKESYYRHNSEYGWDFKELEKKGLFKVLEYKPHQVGRLLDQGGGPIRDAIQQMKAKRLVIDSITSYALLFKDEYQQRENILKFFELIRKWGCTSIIISEMAPKEAETAKGSIGFLVDAIISLYYEKKEEKDVRVHSLEILKMRGTRHTNKVCALNFEKEGIKIYADIEIF